MKIYNLDENKKNDIKLVKEKINQSIDDTKATINKI